MRNLNRRLKIIFFISIVFAGCVLDLIYGCNQSSSIVTDKKEIDAGKLLAARYCSSCHKLPDPSLLTKPMWAEGVLPRMGPFLGIIAYKGKPYARANDVPISSYFPPKPVMDSVSWGRIVNYYLAMAPDVMPGQKKTLAIKRELPFFDVQLPSKFFFNQVSMTSYVKIDTTVKPHRIIVNDGMANRFLVVDNNLQLMQGFNAPGPIVDLCYRPNDMLACIIGQDMEANNKMNGIATPIQINNAGQVTPDAKPLFNKLARPVKINTADLNKDGKPDYIVSQFGNLVGELNWMENKGNAVYVSHTLRKRPGAINNIVYDYNHDGLPDIYAQFAQGEEGIFLFTNHGHGKFEEKQLLRFPPAYGSTSFDLVDFNRDGYPDIVYTCGDNGDYTPILKPYHGVYVFLNDGHNNFTQKYFYPINGCYKAIARDFDGDGLIDIAAVSFFPSNLEPEEAFVYLENTGNFNFQPYSLPPGTPFQKGITMDSGDLDGDGKPDLIIGNGLYTSNQNSKHTEPLFIVLKNITYRKQQE